VSEKKIAVSTQNQDTAYLFESTPVEKLQTLSHDQLIQYSKGLEDLVQQLTRMNANLKKRADELEDKSVLLGDHLVAVKNELYGKSSEKLAAPETTVGDDLDDKSTSPAETTSATGAAGRKPPRKRYRLPSERYPDAELIERHVHLENPPPCKCCGEVLSDSGMTEDREFLTKIPEQILVVREKRHKYRCGKCHGDIQTAPALPAIKPGSAYSDEFIQDVAVNKFCDLIPIDRQVKIAERKGFPGLPPQSLIETTHYLAAFLSVVYEKLKYETFCSRVLHADETPHKMLEGSSTQNWSFWGFSGQKSAYFEAHPTRSGDVASDLLKDASCEVLLSDVYSGYKKAAREANAHRATNGLPPIATSYCNAHARRKFNEADKFPVEREYFLRQYQKIYRLESEARDPEKPQDTLMERLKENRAKMRPIFEEMKAQALSWLGQYSSKSSIVRAMNYFLNNYDEFIFFTHPDRLDVPIDNNPQERLLRSPVIGRKTWYGTHSKQGAHTTSVMFSVMESCKLNRVNPRDYLKAVVASLHAGHAAFTPSEYKLTQAADTVASAA
jgi:transposase